MHYIFFTFLFSNPYICFNPYRVILQKSVILSACKTVGRFLTTVQCLVLDTYWHVNVVKTERRNNNNNINNNNLLSLEYTFPRTVTRNTGCSAVHTLVLISSIINIYTGVQVSSALIVEMITFL
jgi:hypothetical protein